MTEVYRNASMALPRLLDDLLTDGEEVGSRGGERVKELLHQHVVLTHPVEREVLTPGRKASIAAQIAETMWVLAGRDDIEWLSHYLPRAKDFSDNGVTWRGAYGPRMRAWETNNVGDVVDQLRHVVELLKADPTSRRAVITLYNPAIDTIPGKDIPCNNWLAFSSRLGKLDLHVATRSNDLMWGWSGINAFEWSALQEIVAGLLGVQVGELHFSINSLHLYDRHWDRAKGIVEATDTASLLGTAVGLGHPSPRFDASEIDRDLERFDDLTDLWFEAEGFIRRNPTAGHWALIESFPEPMLKSWLQVIAWYWSGDEQYLSYGTPLWLAAKRSPKPKPKHHAEHVHAEYPVGEVPSLPDEPTDPFADYVTKLHREKHEAYGDSWKRRGELLAILANIARKVDRLGVDGAGDTSADTAIDLLVYLIKYRLWLTDHAGVGIPSPLVYELPYQGGAPYSDGHAAVEVMLHALKAGTLVGEAGTLAGGAAEERRIGYLKHDFELLQEAAECRDSGETKRDIVVRMITSANLLARTLWTKEQQA